MGIFDDIKNLFGGIGYDPQNLQRDWYNFAQFNRDISGQVLPNGTWVPGAADPIGAIQHIFGNDINNAVSALNYATSSPDAQFFPNAQPGTPDIQLGPGGPVQTGGQNPYATQQNFERGQQRGQPSLQGQPTPGFAVPGQWLGTSQQPIPGQGQVTQQPQQSGGSAGAKGGSAAGLDPAVAQFLAETGAQMPAPAPQGGGMPNKTMQAPPAAEDAAEPASTFEQPTTQSMVQLILSGGTFTDPETGQVHDFSQLDDNQKYELLVALLAPARTDKQQQGLDQIGLSLP